MKSLKIRNKKAMLELLLDDVQFEKIAVVSGLQRDMLTEKILKEAKKRKIKIEMNPIGKMVRRRSGDTKEVLVGFVDPQNHYSLNALFDKLYDDDKVPFFLLLNRVDFDSNIGVIVRTAFAAGVNGIIYQGNDDRFFNEDTLHYSLGTLARIPLVKMSVFEALHELKKSGIKTFSIDMGSKSIYKERLTGAVAFVLGGEAEGISKDISKKCDGTLSIPMREGIDSLNVGASASIILYEKVRQDGGVV